MITLFCLGFYLLFFDGCQPELGAPLWVLLLSLLGDLGLFIWGRKGAAA